MLERQQGVIAPLCDACATISQETVADDLGLLFEPIAVEAAAKFELIAVAAERMTHQREVIFSVLLGLPDVRHFVDEEALE